MSVKQSESDISLPLAVAALVAVVLAYVYFTHLRFHPVELSSALNLAEKYAEGIYLSLCAFAINLTFFAVFLKRSIGLARQGSRLALLEGRKRGGRLGRNEVLSLLIAIAGYVGTTTVLRQSFVAETAPLVGKEMVRWLEISVSGNMATFFGIVSICGLSLLGSTFSAFSEQS